MKSRINKCISNSVENYQRVLNDEILQENIENIVVKSVDAFRNDKKMLFCGNGGSASDAQHIAAELVSRYKTERKGLGAIALTTDSSILTAIGNDYGFKYIFSRQIEAIGNKGDIIIAITTSGNSQNLIEALKVAKQKKIMKIFDCFMKRTKIYCIYCHRFTKKRM